MATTEKTKGAFSYWLLAFGKNLKDQDQNGGRRFWLSAIGYWQRREKLKALLATAEKVKGAFSYWLLATTKREQSLRLGLEYKRTLKGEMG